MTAISAEATSARPSFWLITSLAVYFGVQTLLRTLYASGLGLDEAELMVTAQTIRAGYGAQPPLYSWLQNAAFAALGANIVALALIKNLLLYATFIFTFLSARLVLEDERRAALATLALFTIPQLAWESQRALSHTVIAVALAAATLYVMLRLLREGKPALYALLGACIGLGALSKYNYVLFAVAMLLAALTIAPLRARLRSPWIVLTFAVAGAVLLPHLAWLAGHSEAALSRVDKFEIAESAGIATLGRSLLAALAAIFNYAALPALVFLGAAFMPLGRYHEPVSAKPPADTARRFILHLLYIGAGLVLVLAIVSRTTEIRDRWLQPLLFILPLGLLILLEPRLAGARGRALASISAGIGIACVVGLAVAHLFPDLSHPQRATVPYRALADEIRGLGFEGGYILANDSYVAGNLRLRFPGSTVAEPEYGLWPSREAQPRSLLIAWDTKDETLPDEVLTLWRRLCRDGTDTDLRSTPLTALFEHSRRSTFTLRVAILPMCTNNEDEAHASAK